MERVPLLPELPPTPPAIVVGAMNGDAHDYLQTTPTRRSGVTSTISTAGSFFGVFGIKFTPLPFNPDELVRRKGVKIYREMSIDEQVKAALLAKKYAVLSTGYEIQSPETPEGESDKEAEEHQKFIEFNFAEMKGSFESKILDILSACVFGFSCTERVMWKIDYGDFEGKWGLKDLKTRPPDDIEFNTDEFGDLTKNGVWQNQREMPADKFVIFSYAKEFGNLYGNSDLRAAYRAWWCKLNMMKLMAVALERYGEPIATATYKGTIDDSQRDDLEGFLKNLQSRSGIVLPDNIVLQFFNPPPRAAEAFIPALQYYDSLIRMSILMPGLIGMSSEQDTGSYARAVKEFDVFIWVLNQLRRDLETCINEQVVKPLLDYNYEIDHGRYPRFKFKEVTEDARYRQFEAFLMGFSGQVLNKGPEDENKLRELINFEPLPEEFTAKQQELDDAKMDATLEMTKMGPMMAQQKASGPPVAGDSGGGNGAPKPPTPSQGSEKGQPKPKELSLYEEQTLLTYIQQMREYSFPDHEGRPGLRGGSLPRTGGSGGTDPDERSQTLAPGQGTREHPLIAHTVEEGVGAILGGNVVEVEDEGTAYFVLSKLQRMATEIKKLGKAAPIYDLCNVMVKGTNLFCAEQMKTKRFPQGIPRLDMPQLGGQPVPGSKAESFPRNPWDPREVDGSKDFIKFVEGHGVKVTSELTPAIDLRPSQRELVGPKVVAMMTDVRFKPQNNPLFVSKDSYIIDGHHRWAAVVARDLEDNKLGDIKMDIRRVDAPMSEVYFMAKRWARLTGMMAAKGANVAHAEAAAEGKLAREYRFHEEYEL